MTQPPQQPQYQMQPVVPGNGLGIASLVLGIIALCTFCVPFLPWILGVIAIILGVISIAQAGGAPTGKAKIGMILATIAIVVGVGFWAFIGYGARKAGNSLGNAIQQAAQQAQDEAKKDQSQLQQLNSAVEKAKELQKMKDQVAPTQPGSMLTRPQEWTVHIA